MCQALYWVLLNIIQCDLHGVMRWEPAAPPFAQFCRRGSWHPGTKGHPLGGVKQSVRHQDSRLGLSGSREACPKDRDRGQFTGSRPSRRVLVSSVSPGNLGVS